MSLKIKLARTGSKANPSYRIVVAEAKSKRDSGYIDLLGNYDPKTDPARLRISREKLAKWLLLGAIPTTSVWRIVNKKGEQVERTA